MQCGGICDQEAQKHTHWMEVRKGPVRLLVVFWAGCPRLCTFVVVPGVRHSVQGHRTDSEYRCDTPGLGGRLNGLVSFGWQTRHQFMNHFLRLRNMSSHLVFSTCVPLLFFHVQCPSIAGSGLLFLLFVGSVLHILELGLSSLLAVGGETVAPRETRPRRHMRRHAETDARTRDTEYLEWTEGDSQSVWCSVLRRQPP